jgi:hypothetical protein
MMVFVAETNIISDVQKEDNPALIAGKNFLVRSEHPDAGSRSWYDSSLSSYPNLIKLRHNMSASEHKPQLLRRLSQSLNLDQLEMLEAELINQGILLNLRSAGYTLAQQVAHEASVWRWRALRFGIEGSALSFQVILPHYLTQRAEELARALCVGVAQPEDSPGNLRLPGTVVPTADSCIPSATELQYLDRFAAYLNGEFESASNRYQRGLNVVLRAISTPARQEPQSATTPAAVVLILALPLTMKDFVRGLKLFKQGSNE